MDRGRVQLQFAGGTARQRIARRDPQAGDRLRVVVQRLLGGRRERQEEPGVEPLRLADRRDPVGDVLDQTGDQPQTLAGAEIDERRSPLCTCATGGVEALLGRRVVEADRGVAVDRPGEQHAGLLEALTDRGHPEGGPPRSRPSRALACSSSRSSQIASSSSAWSAASTRPPGNTYTPPANEAPSARRSMNTSSPSSAVAHEHHGRRRAQRDGAGVELITHGGDGSPPPSVNHSARRPDVIPRRRHRRVARPRTRSRRRRSQRAERGRLPVVAEPNDDPVLEVLDPVGDRRESSFTSTTQK